MSEKERNPKGKKSEGKQPLKRAMTMATVVASLGVSLGVNVGDLLALDLSATDPYGDLSQISTGQGDLMVQVKLMTEQQSSLFTQVNGLLATRSMYPLSKFTVLKSTVFNLANQIKLSQATERNLTSRISTDNASITTKINSLHSREIFLMNQIRTLEANQIKLMNLLQYIAVDQYK